MFDTAAAALADLEELDLDAMSREDLNVVVTNFQVLRGRLEAAEARAIARWDAEKAWAGCGAKTGAAWLAWRCRLPHAVARQRVRHARALRDLPAVAQAWADGEIDRSHITTLMNARTPRTEAAFELDHKELLDAARTRRYREFKRSCDLWEWTVDQDGAEDKAANDRAGRAVDLAQSFGGMWFGRITFDPVSIWARSAASSHEGWKQTRSRTSRPHRPRQPWRAHHAGQRSAGLWLPQPLAQQPPRPRVGRRRPGIAEAKRPRRRPRPTRRSVTMADVPLFDARERPSQAVRRGAPARL